MLHVYMLSHISCVRLCVTLWTAALQAPLSMKFWQARILEWVACSFSKFVLEYSQLTISCAQQSYSAMHPFFPKLPSHPGC